MAHLDYYSKQLLLVDPSVQRAFDIVDKVVVPCKRDDSGTDTEDTVVTDCCNDKLYKRQQCVCSDAPFVWKEVFSINGIGRELLDDRMYVSIVLSIIYCNEALMLHLGTVANSKRCLERALMFYSMAGRSLLENCPIEVLQMHHFTSTLFCGIMNNLAYVLLQTADYDNSRLCYHRLNDFLMGLGPPANELEQRQREEFGLNFILCFKSMSTAAAA